MAKDQATRFKLYGLPVDRGNVLADVFATKLRAFVEALKASDRQINIRKSYDYVIVGLNHASAEAQVRERPSRVLPNQQSSVSNMRMTMKAIYNGSLNIADASVELVEKLADLPKGAGETFGVGEVGFDDEEPIQLDDFFAAQAQRILERIASEQPEEHYKGISLSSFDGLLKRLDHIGKALEGVLILTAGGQHIDCLFDSANLPNLRDGFDKRVRVEALAHYTGESDLPERLDVKRITPIKESADLSRWRGAFKRKRKQADRL